MHCDEKPSPLCPGAGHLCAVGRKHIPRSRTHAKAAGYHCTVHRQDRGPHRCIWLTQIKCIFTYLLLSSVPRCLFPSQWHPTVGATWVVCCFLTDLWRSLCITDTSSLPANAYEHVLYAQLACLLTLWITFSKNGSSWCWYTSTYLFPLRLIILVSYLRRVFPNSRAGRWFPVFF